MKKRLILVLSVLMLTSLLAACTQEAATAETQAQTEATAAATEDTRPKLTVSEIQAIALAEAGADAELLNSIDIHQGEYEGRECVSVMLIIRDKDYQFILDVYTGEVLKSIFPEN